MSRSPRSGAEHGSGQAAGGGEVADRLREASAIVLRTMAGPVFAEGFLRRSGSYGGQDDLAGTSPSQEGHTIVTSHASA